MFEPPRCPNFSCPMFRDPKPRFFLRKGFYLPKCRSVPVPRFRCKGCGLGFSRQTFRVDYRDHKPHLNAPLVRLLASGLGLRQSARILPMARKSTEMKFRKMARQLSFLQGNLREQFPVGSEFELDELITFETCKVTRPLALPVLIEAKSLLVVAAEPATLRPFGKTTARRTTKIEKYEERHGRRPDRSRRSILRVLASAGRWTRHLPKVVLRTDKKDLYRTLAQQVFGEARIEHLQFSSRLPRSPANPIFRINLTAAIARDLNGRLRRRSWLASKQRHFLELQLGIFMTYRNFVRRRVNQDERTPAVALGWLDQGLTTEQLLGWRQDWRKRSGHPLSNLALAIGAVRAARQSARVAVAAANPGGGQGAN